MVLLMKTLLPELMLTIVASICFLLGTSKQPALRRTAPILTILALAVALISQLTFVFGTPGVAGPWQSLEISELSRYIKLATAAIGILLTLLAWPTTSDGSAGRAVYFGTECGEFFGLLLLSVVGLFLVAGANDIMLLFLAIELSSIPTYIMVSISRPLPVAQEAGVKYFFLGAMAAALMLLGFSYLYGTTGTVYLHGGVDSDGTVMTGVDTVMRAMSAGPNDWQKLAVVVLLAGFSFKMTAFPLQVYAADVYQGAATPVTALLSYIPKAAGFVAMLKVLYAFGGSSWQISPDIAHLIWWLAVLTMCFGNVLGLIQSNVKRVFAYSSIAHSGYMLVGVAALVSGGASPSDALRGVLFYLAAYGLTNIAAFGVLAVLPGSTNQPGSSAETYDEIAGLGRQNVGLGLAMSVACFSLIGIPLTVGFVGKVLLIEPALQGKLFGLVVILVINSAISAGYYLRIIAALFLRPASTTAALPRATAPLPVLGAIIASAAGVLLLGAVVPLADMTITRAAQAADLNTVNPPPANQPITASGAGQF